MGTTLSTLTNLAIYIGLVVLGAFLGSRKALRSRPLVWVGKLQFVALMILIVTLGVNLVVHFNLKKISMVESMKAVE